jgi:hypothetical protein
MNARRVADLHRELARVHAELANELDSESEASPVDVPVEEPSVPRPRRVVIAPPPKPRLVRPEGENDELARRKAQTFLRRQGYTKTTR